MAYPSIPLLVFHCDEPWIAYNLARMDPLPKTLYVSDHKTKSRVSTLAELSKQMHRIEEPNDEVSSHCLELHWLSEARICASEHRVHTLFNLRSYCETIEEQLFSRAFVSAVYRALVEDIYVPNADLIEATEDHCEQANIEIDGVDNCIRFLCSHVAQIDKKADSSAEMSSSEPQSPSTSAYSEDFSEREQLVDWKSCEDEQEDYRLAFDELISKHFRKVPNLPNYFFFVNDTHVQLPVSQNAADFRMKLGALSRGRVPMGSGGAPSRTSLSDDVEFSYINEDGTDEFCTHLNQQIDEINTESHDGTDDLDGQSCSESESTSATCISESELLGGESNGDVVPLFLNLCCALRFPNQTMHTFAIDHLPSCMLQLLKQCPDAPANMMKYLDQLEVTLDVYVLSWPSVHAVNEHLDSVLSSPSSRLSSPELFKEPINYFDFDTVPVSADAIDMIAQLPDAESVAVDELRLGISRLLRMEKNLVLSRCNEPSPSSLHNIIDFIVHESEAGRDPERIKMAQVNVVLVMEQSRALQRLRTKIQQLKLGYCVMSKVRDTDSMFYCCDIINHKQFELTYNKNRLQLRRVSYFNKRPDRNIRSGSFSEGCDARESHEAMPLKASARMSTEAVLEHNHDDNTFASKRIERSSKNQRNSVPLPLSSSECYPKRKTSSVSSRVGTEEDQVFMDPSESVRRRELSDFWLILTVDAHEARVYFCQRYPYLHTAIFEGLCKAIETECRTVNQELLLEKMQQTRECDSLLMASDAVPRKVGRDETIKKQLLGIPNTKLTRKYVYPQQLPAKRTRTQSTDEDEDTAILLTEHARAEYREGHFACGIVAHHYFFIHPRLQQSKQPPVNNHSLAVGYEALCHAIDPFAVRNRRNVYVFGEEENPNVFYVRLHMNSDGVRESARQDFDQQWMDEMEEMLHNNILLTVHGVRQPGRHLQAIIETMQKRVDVKVLDELTAALHKNPQTRLTPEDVRFIQRNPASPDAVFHCTLPSFTEDYLGSLYFYLQQQMLTFAIPARFREHCDDVTTQRPVRDRTVFYPCATDSLPLPPSYTPSFFVINRPPSKGYSSLGVACVEVRVVDVKGKCKVDLPYAKLSPHTHSQLYPGGAKLRRAAVERFHELTRCINRSLPLPDSLHSGPGKVLTLVEFNVWQAGDVGLSSLHPRLRLAVQQALCDLVTEFGLLGCHVLDIQAPFSPVFFRAPTFSVSRQRTERYSTPLRKRSSSDALLAPALTSPTKAPLRLEQQPSPLTRNETVRRSAQSASQTMFNFDDNKRSSLTITHPLSVTDGTLTISSSSDELTPAFVNCKFAAVAKEWFDHVVSEVKNNTEQQFSLKKHMFRLDSDHSATKICQVISERLRAAVHNERVTVCHRESSGSSRYCSVSCTGPFVPPFSSDDGRVLESQHIDISLMLIAYDREYADATLHYGNMNGTDQIMPDTLAEVIINEDNSMRFMPQESPFVPRQHLLFFIIRGEVASLYLYNYSPKAAERIHKVFSGVISWHNGRARLLREIGLHKMGITHLSAPLFPSSDALVWLNAALLYKYDSLEDGAPDFDQQFISDPLEPKSARLRMKLYRHTNASFVAFNLMPNFFDNQSQQMLMIQDEVSCLLNDHERFHQVHESLMAGSCEVTETDLIVITTRSRDVHNVKSPLLLFPRWRRRIAVIRASAEAPSDFRHSPLLEEPAARRASGSKLSKYEAPVHTPSRLQFRSNTLESTSIVAPTHTRRITEEDDPCCLMIQFMLVESYVEYAKKLGWHFLAVSEVSPLNIRKNPYTLKYDTQCTQCSPNVWMFRVAAGGIIFLHLSFVEPYFSVRTLIWNASQLSNVLPMEEGNLRRVVESVRELEVLKDDLVSKGHVHSFTYDFHLRMVATYLVGGQQVLFNQGYNTNAFLIDFLQYYECRPHFARNCIYEERTEYSCLPVNSSLIWEHFMGKSNEWRVVRLKTLNSGASDQFMLVSEECKEYLSQSYKVIRVVLHEPQSRVARNCLVIKFYVILVANDRTDPFIEVEGQESQTSSELGEFKEMENTREDDAETEDGSVSQFDLTTDTPESATPCGRRRFCSGEHVPPVHAADISRKLSSEVESMLARSVERYASGEDNTRLSIQKSAPRRHRRQIRPQQDGVVLPREQVTYVHYLSVRQRRLQEELEDSVVHYRLRLQKLVEDAGWHCKRDQLWSSMLECATKRTELNVSSGSRKFFSESSSDVGNVLRNVTSCSLPVGEVDKLLGYVRSRSMCEMEPMLDALTRDFAADPFFRFLVLHFGEKRCRFFTGDVKKHLLIMTNNPQHSAFLMTVFAKDHLEMRLIYKDHESSSENWLEKVMDDQLREQFDEIVRCAASFCWMDVVHSPPSGRVRT